MLLSVSSRIVVCGKCPSIGHAVLSVACLFYFGSAIHISRASFAICSAPSLVLFPVATYISSHKTNADCTRTPDESAGMDEDAPVDPRLLGEHVVPKATPDLRQRLAAVEALGPDGHGLHTPVVGRLVRVQDVDRLGLLGDLQLLLEIGEVLLPRQELVEDDDLSAGGDVGLSGLLDRGGDEVAGRKPGVGVVIKARDELLSDERRSL